MEALSQAGAGSVTISVTGSVAPPGIPLDFVDIVGLDGIEENMIVVVPGFLHALPK